MVYTGGGTLTISGYGFKDGATVAVGTSECEVLSVDPDEILCVIPSSVSYTYLSTIKMRYIAGIFPWGIFPAFSLSADFFQNQLFEKFFQEYNQSVKQFGSRSGWTFCWAKSGSKLFAKVISR